jgi:Sec-independent protein secretion pathway component TatC
MLSGLRSTRRVQHDEQVHITDHLEELRNRIIISLLTLAVGFGLCFWQHERIIEFLNRPLPASVPDPIVLGVAEPFTISLKVALAGAVILAIPVLIYRQVQAGDYYAFVVTILIACGLIFQLPTGVFVLSTVGLMRSDWMRKHRRFAIFGMSIVAAALPGGDVVSMLIIFAALLGLYELSIYVALFVERRKGLDYDLPEEATTEVDAAGGEA